MCSSGKRVGMGHGLAGGRERGRGRERERGLVGREERDREGWRTRGQGWEREINNETH